MNFKDTSVYFTSGSSTPTLLEFSVKGSSDRPFIINNVNFSGGKVDTLIKMDWYSKEVTIHLKNGKATAINLILKCKTY